jgi:threonine dehydrogenase-like Zn-dependent dehydrogenase
MTNTATMSALVYEGPHVMPMREVPVPAPKPDEVLIEVAFSGICGSELSGFLGQNSLRKPPLIMGHEFSGTIVQMGERAAMMRPDLQAGERVTANPLIPCGQCEYCQSGHQQLCPSRKLHSASLPGSNARFITVRADAVLALPEGVTMEVGSLTEPAACAVNTAVLARITPDETALVIGAGPIGLLIVQALKQYNPRKIYCADMNNDRLAMAEASGAIAVKPDDLPKGVHVAVDAVGAHVTRQACVGAVRPAGRVLFVGLHEAESTLPINAMIRSEITTQGVFAYTAQNFRNALLALADGRLYLEPAWTRTEPLANGAACFEELLRGSTVAKIWLQP